MAQGRQEGEAALPLEQPESLAEALRDFQGPNDLTAWLTSHS